MSRVTERRACDVGHHVVHFYDGDADLLTRAGRYLSEGLHAGAAGVVIATEAHREAFEGYLGEAGVDVAAALGDGTLVAVDAAESLARIASHGGVDRAAFFDVVGSLVRTAAATGRPVRAYGEMVALLWDAGDVIAAIDLERLWNELATEVPFSLYCAYRSDAVSGQHNAAALEQVCKLHTAVLPGPALEQTWQFTDDLAAPAAARRLVADALRSTGHGADILTRARLVVGELAANAVVHARTPFSVSIRSEQSTVLIRVRDQSPVMPAVRPIAPTSISGRGMRLVTALASRWGVDLAADGKVVWAELAVSGE